MNLRQAVKKVIFQNKTINYIPTRFIEMTGNGEITKLEEVVSRLVLKDELLEFLEKAIEKYGKVLAIEDLIKLDSQGFMLSNEVKRKSNARSDWFNILRKTDDNWIKSFFN